MIDQERVDIHARLKALETVLQFTLAMTYKAGKLQPDGIPDLHDFLLTKLSQQGVPGIDPAMSDHLTSEWNEATRKLLDGAALLFSKLPNTS